MDWLLTLGIAFLTGAVTLSGVALQNNAAAKRAKLESSERSSSETARIAREDAIAKSQQVATERAEASALAAKVSEKFVEDLHDVRSFQEVDDDGFRTWFEQTWSDGKEVALRLVVGRVRDDDDRAALMEVLDALAAQAEFTRWNRTRTPRSFVDGALLLGLDISMTMERGQEQTDDLIMRRAELADRVGQWENYVAAKEAHEWEEERRAFKLEELQWEADLDAAQEAAEDEERELQEQAQWESEADQEAFDAARGAEELAHTWDDEPEIEDDPRER